MFPVKEIAKDVRMCHVQTDRFKTACTKITMALPILTSKELAATALLSQILRHSCKKYPDFTSLSCRMDELYGAGIGPSAIKLGEAEILRFTATCIDDRFALEKGESITGECAALLAEMLFNPDLVDGSFKEDIIAEEKRLLLQRIDEEINDKRRYARVRCEELMCNGEKYGLRRYGTREDVEKLTSEDICAAWQRILRSSKVMIASVGSSDGSEIAKIFSDGFAKVDRCAEAAEAEFRTDCGEPKRYEESFDVNQGKLVLGFRTGNKSYTDDFYAATLAIDLFGGNVYSKLFLNVREKLSLCYYCWARYIARKGLMIVDCGIDTANEKKATDEILAQLEDVKNGIFTDEDIEAAKKGMYERWVGEMDEPSDICCWYADMVYDDEILTPEEMYAELEKVTREQICAAAKRIKLDTVYMLSAKEGAENED